jgi:hypothetical protein
VFSCLYLILSFLSPLFRFSGKLLQFQSKSTKEFSEIINKVSRFTRSRQQMKEEHEKKIRQQNEEAIRQEKLRQAEAKRKIPTHFDDDFSEPYFQQQNNNSSSTNGSSLDPVSSSDSSTTTTKEVVNSSASDGSEGGKQKRYSVTIQVELAGVTVDLGVHPPVPDFVSASSSSPFSTSLSSSLLSSSSTQPTIGGSGSFSDFINPSNEDSSSANSLIRELPNIRLQTGKFRLTIRYHPSITSSSGCDQESKIRSVFFLALSHRVAFTL